MLSLCASTSVNMSVVRPRYRELACVLSVEVLTDVLASAAELCCWSVVSACDTTSADNVGGSWSLTRGRTVNLSLDTSLSFSR